MNRAALPLPTRDGVGPSCIALPPGPWATIAACLAERLPAVTPAQWAARIAAGEVIDEHGLPVTADRAHRPHLKVFYYRVLDDEPPASFDDAVLFQDAQLVVADKPHFQPVTPTGPYLQRSLLVRLKRRLGIDSLAPVHRIDRETAGLVLFSVDPATRGAYQRLFAERRVAKTYECIARWRGDLAWPLAHASRLVDDPSHFMRMSEVPGAPNAFTDVDLVERRGDVARYRLVPRTGRRHQLRVHCEALGIPIVGDRIYPALLPVDTDDPAEPLRLLAQRLAFIDPLSGIAREFSSRRRLEWPR